MNRLLMLLLLINLGSFNVLADDPGITKVRLIQQADTTYVLEADVPQNILSAIKTPIFPERFVLTNFKFTNQSGWITLRMHITTSGDPLSADEEIVLPWIRNGIDFTAQWLDGSTYKGLFNRSLNGIHIPMIEVMPTSKTTLEVLAEGFLTGIHHWRFKLIHVLFIILLLLNFPGKKTFAVLFSFSMGQAASTILVELTSISIDILYADILIALFMFIVAYAVVTSRKLKYGWAMLFSCGLIHGISYASEIANLNLQGIQKIQSLFAFNIAMDIGNFFIAGICYWIFKWLVPSFQIQRKATVLFGGLSVCLILLVFNENIFSGTVRILDFGSEKQSISIPVANKPSTGPVKRGAGKMTTPVMVFLSVEPYEIRQEILIKAGTVLKFLDPENNSPVIPVKDQEELKQSISDIIVEKSILRVSKQELKPVEIKSHFVRLSRGGVSIRESPMQENSDECIIGITCLYDVESFPDSIHFNWQFFPDSAKVIEVSVVDPHGALTAMLDQQNHIIKWGSRLSGFQLPKVEPITIEQYPFPVVSVLMWFIGLLFLLWSYFRKKLRIRRFWVMVFIALAFLCYPFVRAETVVPFLPEWKPSEERTSIILNDLMTNVYRAFDRRKESDVYDRLSMSVTGDQLTEIYLQNRQAMALENRGGARAGVDEVKILEVHNIDYARNDGFVADAAWTVRGSVNHFGHTHYRQNQYRALVTFHNDNNIWKISSIEAIDEKRIY